MSLLQYGTRPLVIRLLGGDYTTAELVLSIRRSGEASRFIEVPDSELSKQLEDGNTIVTWVPTQDEAGAFVSGSAFAQVNIIEDGDARNATKELPITIDVNQIRRVIYFGGA